MGATTMAAASMMSPRNEFGAAVFASCPCIRDDHPGPVELLFCPPHRRVFFARLQPAVKNLDRRYRFRRLDRVDIGPPASAARDDRGRQHDVGGTRCQNWRPLGIAVGYRSQLRSNPRLTSRPVPEARTELPGANRVPWVRWWVHIGRERRRAAWRRACPGR
jgi:hypothetical protein